MKPCKTCAHCRLDGSLYLCDKLKTYCAKVSNPNLGQQLRTCAYTAKPKKQKQQP